MTIEEIQARKEMILAVIAAMKERGDKLPNIGSENRE